MELAKDLFLTDERAPYLSLVLVSRDLDSHRLLSGLSPEETAALHGALASSAAAVRSVLTDAWQRQEARTAECRPRNAELNQNAELGTRK